MKLQDLYEKTDVASGPPVISKIISYIGKKLGAALIRIPGIEHFRNSSQKGYGLRFVLSGSTRCIRFNWQSEGSMGKITSLTSIDLFTGKSHDPNFTIKMQGLSILQALPVVLDILQQPKIGTQTVLPIDPKLAMTSDVTESVNSGKSNDAAERVWKRLKTIADANKSKVSADEESLTKRDIKSKLSKGWTESEIVSLLRNTEHISPGIPEETALARMTKIKKSVEQRLSAIKEGVVLEAKRDDYTTESALSDFLHQLSRGETFTRTGFIARYHITHVGIFDTIMSDFSDRFIVDGKRISLASNKGLDSLKDSILSKAGVVEVSKGGTKETYFKTPQEEEVEKEDRIPYADTLEHLEGLVQAIIKGSFNALFVAGKGGTGKTQTVENVLHSNGLTDGSGYFKNTGAASASGLYTLLYHHRNDILLFDDSDGVFKDGDARNILKAATDTKKSRKLVWNKKSSFIFNPDEVDPKEYEDDLSMAPQFFEYKGRIIFISNLSIDQLDPDGAIRTRAFIINVDPTDEELFDHMGKILMDIRLENDLTLSKEEREHVLSVVKTSKRKGDVSLRKLVRALNLAASGAPNWEKLVELYA